MPKKQSGEKTPKVSANIFTKPATINYPFVKPEAPAYLRGEPVFDFELCINCGLCSRNCPAGAIEMVDVDGKKHPQLKLGKCIFCYLCVETCPKKAIKQSSKYDLATTDKSTLIVKPKPNSAVQEPQRKQT
jgi:formate hydrogenlyase subunit 6/NADH:ubiquinone oxidoreductase subunit I